MMSRATAPTPRYEGTAGCHSPHSIRHYPARSKIVCRGVELAPGLFDTAAGQPPAVLLPLPNGHHRHPGLDLEIRFHRTDDQPYTMELRQEGGTHTAIADDQPADRT